ncbi:Uma2 family endonuclease [Egbenema bharatensis]|uniref:Uma2 family endonuclease n=1 Tax=Egbenema bharatensis TaxID=3463334 RepID=UPI003A85154F
MFSRSHPPLRPLAGRSPAALESEHRLWGKAMTQAQVKFPTFEDYLSYSNAMNLEGFYELIDGELVELPPESEQNNWFALNLRDYLIRLIRRRLVRVHACEVQVPVLHPKDAANRFPDLVVLRQEHLELTQRRLTITLDMPPPRLIAEVVSPGKTNQDRDYINKRAQYAAIGVPEYWLIDPVAQTVMVLRLEGETYQEIGVFDHQSAIASVEFAGLELTVAQLFESEI